MKAIRTQFDAGEFSGAVATPSCCSSCCCCCCVTTFATASVTGAAAAAAASRHRKLSSGARVCGVVLGMAAPWLVVLPFWSMKFAPFNRGILELTAYGVLVVLVAYLVFFILLKRQVPVRTGMLFTAGVMATGLLELIVATWSLALIKTFAIYFVLAPVLSLVLSLKLLSARGNAGRTLPEFIAGLPPQYPGQPQDEQGDASGG